MSDQIRRVQRPEANSAVLAYGGEAPAVSADAEIHDRSQMSEASRTSNVAVEDIDPCMLAAMALRAGATDVFAA
jgi:hypothetical protein